MQGGDLLVEQVAALIEAPQVAGDYLLDRAPFDGGPAGQLGRQLEQVQGAAGVAVGGLGQQAAQFGLQGPAGQAALGVGQGLVQNPFQVVPGERLEHIGAGPGQQGVVERERGVLGGGTDEYQGAPLDVGQKGILLRLVEAVHLVDKQDRGPAFGLARLLGLRHRGTDVLDPRQHRRQAKELGPGMGGDQARQGGLAGARRAPQDQRVQAVTLDGPAQRLALTQHLGLADVLVEVARPHAVRQGPGLQRSGGEQIRGRRGISRCQGRLCRAAARNGTASGPIPGCAPGPRSGTG